MKNFILIIGLILCPLICMADTPPPNQVTAKTYSGNGATAITATGSSLNVNVSNTVPVSGTFWQTIQPVSQSGSWTNACTQSGSWSTGRTWSLLSSTDSVNVGNFPSSQAVTGTFWQTTQPVSGTVTVNQGTPGSTPWPVSLSSVPLPTGGSTSALQTSGNSTLSTISGQLPTTLGVKTSANSLSIAPASDAAFPVTGTFWQTTQPVSGSLGRSWNLSSGSDSVSAVQSGTWTVGLPSGASTSSLQTTGNTSLASIATNTGNIPAQGQALAAASLPVVLTAAQVTTLTPPTSVTVTQGTGSNLHADIDNFPSSQAVTGTFWQATQPVSASSLPLPTSASTSALQSTGNTALSTINSTLGSPFQSGGSIGNTSFGSTPLVYTNGSASNSTAVGSSGVVTFSPPTHAVGFVIEAESSNTVNLRYACGTTATTSVGMLLEPGRDSGYIQSACTVTIIAVSSTSQSADIQWVLSQ